MSQTINPIQAEDGASLLCAPELVRNHPRQDPSIELEQVSYRPVGVETTIRKRNSRGNITIERRMEVADDRSKRPVSIQERKIRCPSQLFSSATSRSRKASLISLMQLNQKVAEQIHANKPGTVAFLQYINEEGTELSIIHVFPDFGFIRPACQGSRRKSEGCLRIHRAHTPRSLWNARRPGPDNVETT